MPMIEQDDRVDDVVLRGEHRALEKRVVDEAHGDAEQQQDRRPGSDIGRQVWAQARPVIHAAQPPSRQVTKKNCQIEGSS